MDITELQFDGYERVASCVDGDYHGLIAIHSTALGPAVGGTRLWRYDSDETAVKDLLRLARGMTYKNALAGIPFGGGKSIILRPDSVIDREKIFRAHGRFVETFGGRYITAEDVGTSPDDMAIVRRETSYAAGLHGLSGDPFAIHCARRLPCAPGCGETSLGHGRDHRPNGCAAGVRQRGLSPGVESSPSRCAIDCV